MLAQQLIFINLYVYDEILTGFHQILATAIDTTSLYYEPICTGSEIQLVLQIKLELHY
jgi:hypothetical protein